MSGTDPDEKAADAVLSTLCGRKGFDYWWEDIPPEIQSDIRQAIADDIRSVYKGTDQDEQ